MVILGPVHLCNVNTAFQSDLLVRTMRMQIGPRACSTNMISTIVPLNDRAIVEFDVYSLWSFATLVECQIAWRIEIG